MKKLKFIKVNPEDVKKYGTSSAIILGLIEGWCDYHKRKNIKLTENYWSGYMTYEMVEEQTGIPARTARRRINDLVNTGVITWACFSKVSYDKRRWYRRVDHGSKMEPTHSDKMELPPVQNGTFESSKMEPTITNTSTNTSNNTSITKITGNSTGVENLITQYKITENKEEYLRWLINKIKYIPTSKQELKEYNEYKNDMETALEIIKQMK